VLNQVIKDIKKSPLMKEVSLLNDVVSQNYELFLLVIVLIVYCVY